MEMYRKGFSDRRPQMEAGSVTFKQHNAAPWHINSHLQERQKSFVNLNY